MCLMIRHREKEKRETVTWTADPWMQIDAPVVRCAGPVTRLVLIQVQKIKFAMNDANELARLRDHLT